MALKFLALLGTSAGFMAATNSGLHVSFSSPSPSSPHTCWLLFRFFLCLPFPTPFFPDHPIFHPCWFLGGPGEDLERNDGSQERPYFMSPELKDILLKGSSQAGKQEEVEEE